jgi:hypothetical protein
VADEVPDDEEVTGEAHLDDDVDLRLEALFVARVVDRLAERRELLEPVPQPFSSDVGEVRRRLEALRNLEVGEHRAAEHQFQSLAHLADGEARGDGAGQLAEFPGHLVGRLEVHLRRTVVRRLGLGVRASRLCAREVKLRVGVAATEVVDVVGRDEGQAELVGAFDENAVQDRLLDQVVILQLDEKRPRIEGAPHAIEHVEPGRFALLEHALRDDASHTPGQGDDSLALPGHPLPRHARRDVARGLDLPHRHDADEVSVPLFVTSEQDQVIDRDPPLLAPLGRARDVDFAAEDGGDAALLACLVELERSEHVAVVGHGDGAHAELFRAVGELADADGAVEERVLGVDVEVDELGGHRRAPYTRPSPRSSRLPACPNRT